MTQKEINAVKKTLPSRFEYRTWTEEQKRLDWELSCRDMINSCLVYSGIRAFWERCEWRTGDKSYADPYVRALGRKRVEELVAEQEADFAKAKVFRDVYTDSEGVSYNSIRWGDEYIQLEL